MVYKFCFQPQMFCSKVLEVKYSLYVCLSNATLSFRINPKMSSLKSHVYLISLDIHIRIFSSKNQVGLFLQAYLLIRYLPV
jgi:hypothetical protein